MLTFSFSSQNTDILHNVDTPDLKKKFMAYNCFQNKVQILSIFIWLGAFFPTSAASSRF